MTQLDTHRHGHQETFVIPDSLPIELEGYPFPKPVQRIVAAGEAAWLAAMEAQSAWEDATADLEDRAPQQDKALLIAAIRDGKGDPGTPNTDLARRAEEVAWVRFEVARTDSVAPLNESQKAVAEYFRQHGADVAARELDLIAAAHQATARAQEAAGQAIEARAAVGLAYVHLRWFIGENFQPDPFMFTRGDDLAHDARVADTYRVMAGLEPLLPQPALAPNVREF